MEAKLESSFSQSAICISLASDRLSLTTVLSTTGFSCAKRAISALKYVGISKYVSCVTFLSFGLEVHDKNKAVTANAITALHHVFFFLYQYIATHICWNIST